MGTISTGTGLISGIDIQGTVDKLMAIEHQPVDFLQIRVKLLTAEKTAFQNLAAQILAMKLTVTPFKSAVTFRANSATSSNDQVLTAKASSTAVPGLYSFNVLQVLQNHQMVSQGFNDADQTAIGTGDISLELGQGNLDRNTDLSFLRNQQGIRRGTIRITDRSGASANIDLSSAITVDDVLEKINQTLGIHVQARVSGDRFILEDTSGATAQNLIVQDINGGYTAQDLGLAGNVSGNTITGSDVIGLTNTTALKFLNDGNGIRTNGFGDDLQFTLRDGTGFNVDLNAATLDSSLGILNNGQGVRAGSIKITNRNGLSGTIDLSAAATLGDVVNAINGSNLSVSATLVGGTKLMITDSSGGTTNLKIENVDNGSTATDLGLATEIGANSLTGSEIYRVATLGDVKRAIEDAAHRASNPDKISVAISADGKGLTLTDATGGTGDLVIGSLSGSHAAEDLGLAGSHSTASVTGMRLVAGLNTVLLRNLNGGSGVAGGIIEIQNRGGTVTQVDLHNAQTFQDVLDTINNTAGIGVRAGLNSAHTGIVLEDLTGSTAANLRISDVDATTANDLHLIADSASNRVDSGNNQLRYISENTKLSQLNAGKGISAGAFTITDSAGHRSTVTLSSTDVAQKTVGDLLTLIQSQTGLSSIQATINANGDGILLTDTAGGAGTLTVANSGSGTTASDLNIAKSASIAGNGTIDGSYEYHITVGGSDTLQTVMDKINSLKKPFTAAIINDGGSSNSYHLSLTSQVGGRMGRILFNGGPTELNLYDLVEPQDAVVSLGNSSGGNAIVATSNTNTFTGLIPGLTLTALAPSDGPVTITVAQDTDTMVSKVQDFVDKFNAILTTIDGLTKYDPETQQGGVLLGNYEVQSIRDKLYNLVISNLNDVGDFHQLNQLGITLGSDSKLSLDEEKLTSVLSTNSQGVEDFFSTKDKGMGYRLDKLTDDLTRSSDGEITRTTGSYDDRTKMLNDRISFLEDLLKSKEQRLYNQFYAMEASLAQMQTMQTALASITLLSSNTSSSNNKSA